MNRIRAGAAALTLGFLGGLAGPAHGQDDPPLPVPRLVGPRAAAERPAALAKFGGGATTEAAVTSGLDWLARHQDDDGGWDADGFDERCAGDPKCAGKGRGQHGEDIPCPFDGAISALATLAFLGRGHVPDPEGDETAQLVDRALLRLESGVRDAWGAAIATEAFAEAEALERKGRWRDAARRGAERLLAARQPDGGWGYAAGFRRGSDVPFTAFVVQALAAARDAGIEGPADLGEGVDRFLGSLEEDRGKLAYLKDGRAYGYTPTTTNAHCAAAIRELLQAGTGGARHRAHLALVAAEKPAWKISFREIQVPGRGKVPVQVGNLSMVQWWYGTIAAFHAGGPWSGYFGAVKNALLPHQVKQGCARGSWDPVGTYERQTGGRVFATAMGVLMLEQPYRHRRAGK